MAVGDGPGAPVVAAQAPVGSAGIPDPLSVLNREAAAGQVHQVPVGQAGEQKAVVATPLVLDIIFFPHRYHLATAWLQGTRNRAAHDVARMHRDIAAPRQFGYPRIEKTVAVGQDQGCNELAWHGSGFGWRSIARLAASEAAQPDEAQAANDWLAGAGV
jgi:hypothetical protein